MVAVQLHSTSHLWWLPSAIVSALEWVGGSYASWLVSLVLGAGTLSPSAVPRSPAPCIVFLDILATHLAESAGSWSHGSAALRCCDVGAVVGRPNGRGQSLCLCLDLVVSVASSAYVW